MKKLSLICPIFLCLLILSACSQSVCLNQSEELIFSLPEWPPKNAGSNPYPKLYTWKIEINQVGKVLSFYQKEGDFCVTFFKNQPASITALPITLLDDGERTSYFYPAGFLYPSSYQAEKNSLTWEEGFSAQLIHKIVCSQEETGVSSNRLLKFLLSFNWKKLQENINSKIEKSIEEEDKAVFNPWQINSDKLLDNICYGNFKTSLLNISGIYTYQLEYLFPNQEFSPLSAFIPENACLMQKNLINLQKEKANLIADGHKSAIIFTPYSAKNLSRVYTYMPIYSERL